MRRSLLSTVLVLLCSCAPPEELPPPNVLWLTSEDNGPHLGAYGDTFADTPHLDALAAGGVIFTNAWSNAPVCAPARTTIISGMYPTGLGAQHMRSMVPLPPGMLMFPQVLGEAGYFTTNNVKEDYNLVKPGTVWHESSRQAHWRNRPDSTQPFFAVFNFTTTHESQIRMRPHTPVHDPAKVRVPAYHPDTPEVRLDWAQYYDKLTEMDAQAGEILRQLEEDGLTERTIVFYYGDHGPGMPRSKRWTYDSGLRVPLIVYVPERYRNLAPEDWTPGGRSDRPVGFIDLAPTVLSLAGIEPPAHMQGQAFMGRFAAPARAFNYGFRDRMDERLDMTRAVKKDRYVYVRNYHPHTPYGQFLWYMFETPTTRVWKSLFDQGALNEAQAAFWKPKPAEELYDLAADPDETENLAGSVDHQQILEELREAERRWVTQTRDLGFLPEAEMHTRSGSDAPYVMGHDPNRYPIERILPAAELAASLNPDVVPEVVALLSDEDSAVRYWGVMGLLMRGTAVVVRERESLIDALEDPAPTVRVAAAEALGRFGSDADAVLALDVLLAHADPVENGIYLAVQALNAVDQMDSRAARARARVAALPDVDPQADARMENYVARLKEKILADLE